MAPSSDQDGIFDKREGVLLSKSLETEEYQLPSIELEFTSQREDTVTVRLRDPIPDGVAPGDVGFHREYGQDYWEIEDEQLVFEYELGPYEEFHTAYAFRPENVQVTADFVRAPDQFDVVSEEPAVPDPQPMARSGAESPYSADDDDQPDSSQGGEKSEPGETIDLDDPKSTSKKPDPNAESIAAQLAVEIETGRVSEEHLDILEERFSGTESSGGSEAARLRQLQEDVTNLRAYTNAIEEFLNEEGSGQELLEEFRGDVQEVQEGLESVQQTTSQLEGKVETLESEVHEIDNSLSSLSSDLDEFKADLESLDDEVQSIDDRVPKYSIDERFADLQEELETINDFVENLKTAFE